jgi:hypothetical protein
MATQARSAGRASGFFNSHHDLGVLGVHYYSAEVYSRQLRLCKIARSPKPSREMPMNSLGTESEGEQNRAMQKKSGKFLADWRDASGVRQRKAFPTLKDAQTHQVPASSLSDSSLHPDKIPPTMRLIILSGFRKRPSAAVEGYPTALPQS